MMQEMPKPLTPIVLCADDYAQHAGVDQAILQLVQQQRLSAVSCMTSAPRWHSASAPALREVHDGSFEIGLHFNLTEGFGIETVPNLPSVLLRSYAHAFSRQEMLRRWQQQLDAFEDAMHCAPDFIDGHQHVHQLPLIRDVMFSALQRYADHIPWVRTTTCANPAWGGKAKILQRLGGSHLARRLQQQKIQTNHGFAGVYGFDRADYSACLDEWLPSVQAGSLLMCHPGAALDQHDPISAQRLVEFAYLQSEQFPAQLEKHGACLRRFQDCWSAV